MNDLIMRVNEIKDSRQKWKVKYNLLDILVIVILSVLTGHNDFKEMVIFAETHIEILRKYIKLENGIHHKDTIKRVIVIIDPVQLNYHYIKYISYK